MKKVFKYSVILIYIAGILMLLAVDLSAQAIGVSGYEPGKTEFGNIDVEIGNSVQKDAVIFNLDMEAMLSCSSVTIENRQKYFGDRFEQSRNDVFEIWNWEDLSKVNDKYSLEGITKFVIMQNIGFLGSNPVNYGDGTGSGRIDDTRWGWYGYKDPVNGVTGAFGWVNGNVWYPYNLNGVIEFDGGGYTISGLSVQNKNNTGLFGTVSGNAVVENIKLAEVNIDVLASNVGGIAGSITNATISNCHLLSGNIKANGQTGGIIGNQGNNTLVENCSSAGSIIANSGSQFGGLIGKIGDNNTTVTNAQVTNCNSSVSIHAIGNTYEIGGLIGIAGCRSEITTENVSISYSYATGNLTVDNVNNINLYVGGFIGRATSGAVIRNCYATGTVNARGQCGGFIGMSGFYVHILNCYAIGAVNAGDLHYFGGYGAGGFIGTTWVASSLTNCYGAGRVTALNVGSTGDIGGFIGFVGNQTYIYNCYFDKGTTGRNNAQGTNGNSINPVQITPVEHEDFIGKLPSSTFGTFPNTIWGFETHNLPGGITGKTFPYLLWQEHLGKSNTFFENEMWYSLDDGLSWDFFGDGTTIPQAGNVKIKIDNNNGYQAYNVYTINGNTGNGGYIPLIPSSTAEFVVNNVTASQKLHIGIMSESDKVLFRPARSQNNIFQIWNWADLAYINVLIENENNPSYAGPDYKKLSYYEEFVLMQDLGVPDSSPVNYGDGSGSGGINGDVPCPYSGDRINGWYGYQNYDGTGGPFNPANFYTTNTLLVGGTGNSTGTAFDMITGSANMSWETDKGWKPIGIFDYVNTTPYWKGVPFRGIFLGNDHTISGLWINRVDDIDVGLFRAIELAEIRNLNVQIDQKGITGGKYADFYRYGSTGGFIGTIVNDSGEVILEDLSVVEGSGFITGPGACGGIVGGVYSLKRTDYNFHNTILLGKLENHADVIGSNAGERAGIIGCANNISDKSQATLVNHGNITGRHTAGIFGWHRQEPMRLYFTGLAPQAPREIQVINTGNIFGAMSGGYFGQTWWPQDPDGPPAGIYDVVNTADITGIGSSAIIGGIIGFNESSATVTRCGNSGNISGGRKSGGIVGNNEHDTDSKFYLDHDYPISLEPTIIGCWNTGNITGERWAGGIVGSMDAWDIHFAGVFNSWNTGNVNATGTQYYSSAGGIVGASNTSGMFKISSCWNAGDIASPNGLAGGLIGEFAHRPHRVNHDTVTFILNNYNLGNISSTNGNAGGLIGEISVHQKELAMENCYNAGRVQGNVTGGVFAVFYGSTDLILTNVYWDTITSGQNTGHPIVPRIIGAAQGKSTTQLIDVLNTLNFPETVWGTGMHDYKTYPYLLYQATDPTKNGLAIEEFSYKGANVTATTTNPDVKITAATANGAANAFNPSAGINQTNYYKVFIPGTPVDVPVTVNAGDKYSLGLMSESGIVAFDFGEEPSEVELDITLFLQGVTQAGPIMTTYLQGPPRYDIIPDKALPKKNPFTNMPEYYSQINEDSGTAGQVVDWVLVEIMTNLESFTLDGIQYTYYDLLESRALLLKPDGSVVDTNGNKPLFQPYSSEKVRIAIKTRNHLSVISSELLDFDSNVKYDFSENVTKALKLSWASYSAMIEKNGVACLYGGDVWNGLPIDRTVNIINAVDIDRYNNKTLSTWALGDYMFEDVNMDAMIDSGDGTYIITNGRQIIQSPLLYYIKR